MVIVKDTLIIPEGVKKIIHVNRNILNANRKHNKKDPPVTVKTTKDNYYGMEVSINGPSNLIYNNDNPLSCGARLWIETESEIIIKGKNESTIHCSL